MNLQEIVIDFEYAEKLKELKVKQESLCNYDDFKHFFYSSEVGNIPENYSAFTSDELLEMLPDYIEFNLYYSWLKIGKYKKHNNYYYTVIYDSLKENIEDIKFSNALAKMLIYLIENSLIKI
jgi:hypothetical protein